MKKLIIKILPAILIIFLSGCYTVVWNPNTQLPSENAEYNRLNYYGPDYYGDYYYYYGRPWWWSINLPSKTDSYERSSTVNTLRNNGDRQSGDDRNIIKTDRPAVGSGNSSKPDASKSNSGSSNSTTRPSNSGSRDNGSLRNNDGSRNSGSRR